MKPKLNKLITLLLILGTFAFLMEAEERISAVAQKELSKWASLLPVTPEEVKADTLAPNAQYVTLEQIFLPNTSEKVIPVNN